jgi:hypothetical protein
MFRDDRQRAAVCRTVCAQAGLTFWTEDGPTERAKQLLKDDGGPMSTGERIMFLAAFALWNGHGKVLFADVADRLDGPNLECLGTLLVALSQGAEAVDAWLDRHGAGN